LNILEPLDLKSMGYNSARYVHALHQAMNMAFADRDFYYGDTYFPPAEPVKGLLSKEYALQRASLLNWQRNQHPLGPGDPYPFQGEKNPFLHYLTNWASRYGVTNRAAAVLPQSHSDTNRPAPDTQSSFEPPESAGTPDPSFRLGTTSIQAADEKGWAISVTPSGGWLPVCIAGRTGIGMSQRMQSFVLEEAENPFNVVAPGKRPRVTLTPSLALKGGKPFLCFSVQGGDTQDQNLLQFFLNMVEFGMTVQEACEAANITSYQMRASFENHIVEPGRMTVTQEFPSWVRNELRRMGYRLDLVEKNSGPITAIYFDQEHGTFWGGASDYGEDYGIAW
jgi:gamma-glutamyltranspeptidase/glutathione hydrolase